MTSTTKRHPGSMKATIGADGKGRVTGMVFDGVFGSGFVTTAQLNGASSRVAANNGSYVTGDPGANNPGGVTLFALDQGGLPSAAKFYGGIAISRLLTDSEIASCRTYFGAKAGLTL